MNTGGYCNELLSIIIPVYNAEKYFDRCINSVLKQSFKNIEIIVVNDGSEGNIRETIKKYLNTDTRVRFIDNEINQGLFRARICGAKKATGSYIAFLDSDDYVSYDFYRALIQKAYESESDITIGKTVWEQNDGYKFIYNYHESCLTFDVLEGEDVRNAYFEQEASCYSWHTIWNKIYSINLWRSCEPFFCNINEHIVMTEDILFSSILFYNARRVSRTNNDAYFYCLNEGASTNVNNMTVSRFVKNVRDIQNVFSYVHTYLIDMNADDKYVKHFEKAKQYYSTMWRHFYEYDFRNDKKYRIPKDVLDFIYSEGNLEPSFYFESAKTEWSGGLEYIKEQIGTRSEKVITFDIFDTLISRNLYEPSDLFLLMNEKYYELTGSSTGFTEFRVNGERESRRIVGKKGYEDTTLNEIYECIENKYGIDKDVLTTLKELEIQLEKNLSFARVAGKELFELAKYLDKKLYLISDMYLEMHDVEIILQNAGYRGYQKIFLSSNCRKLKSTGNLFKYFLENTGISPSEVIHIGDSWSADIQMANREGIDAYFLPKAKEVYENAIKGAETNKCSTIGQDLFCGIIDVDQTLKDPGIRVMRAMVFNSYFDNPYRTFNKKSDFNIDPYFIGYATLGMHLAGVCKWIESICKEKKHRNIHFCARDGALLLRAVQERCDQTEAFDNLNYLQASRKSLMPAIVRNPQDLYRMPVEYRGQTPKSILKLLWFAVEENEITVEEELKNEGINPDQKFNSAEQFDAFITWFINNLYSSEKHKHALEIASQYYSQVGEEDLIFDMGYSGRIIDAIAYCCGHTVEAAYIHTNHSSVWDIKKYSESQIHEFYQFKPRITGLIREEIMSEVKGSCVGFEKKDNIVVPIIEDSYVPHPDIFPIIMIQRGALDFIKSMNRIEKQCGRRLDFSPLVASIPFEGFLRQSSIMDRQIFSSCLFEDEVYGGGKELSVLDYINMQLAEADCFSEKAMITTERDTFMELIHRSSKLKRALLYLITDTSMFKQKLKKNIKEWIS